LQKTKHYIDKLFPRINQLTPDSYLSALKILNNKLNPHRL